MARTGLQAQESKVALRRILRRRRRQYREGKRGSPDSRGLEQANLCRSWARGAGADSLSPGMTVALFLPMTSEPDVRGLLGYFWQKQVRVLVPDTLPDASLQWRVFAAKTADAAEGVAGAGDTLADAVQAAKQVNLVDAADIRPAGMNSVSASKVSLAAPKSVPLSPSMSVHAQADSQPRPSLRQAQVVFVPALAIGVNGERLGQGGGSYDRVIAELGPDALTVGVVFPWEFGLRVPCLEHDREVRAVLTPELFRMVS